ncbi:MAG TPA: transketolase C-terminal domain-containing protein [Methanomassiliicoccales archaeon]|nr:transketolase C-terminal domain-containing protein [Methanomassiliicoccales archaeon]
MRTMTYVGALNEALHQLLEDDENVILIGQGVTSPWYVGQSCTGLIERFGDRRVIDTPVSENAVTGAAVGAALAGLRPILEHPRLDFMYYAMDPIANHAANWHYMFGDQLSVPLTIWGIVNRGGEQGAQHSQSTHAMYAHLPGLKVVMPSTPFDVKGLLRSCVYENNPVLFVDDRWLYPIKGDVPEDHYSVPIGKGTVRRTGKDVTIVATSFLVHEAAKAAEALAAEGIDVELVDPLTVKPLDSGLIISSVKKTRRLVVVDGGWRSYGAASEIMATIGESAAVGSLAAPMKRITLPDSPAPASRALERYYFKNSEDITREVRKVVGGSK